MVSVRRTFVREESGVALGLAIIIIVLIGCTKLEHI